MVLEEDLHHNSKTMNAEHTASSVTTLKIWLDCTLDSSRDTRRAPIGSIICISTPDSDETIMKLQNAYQSKARCMGILTTLQQEVSPKIDPEERQ